MHLSVDHSKMIGLSFDSGPEARDFYDWLSVLTSDPANISLNGPCFRMNNIQTAVYEEAKRYETEFLHTLILFQILESHYNKQFLFLKNEIFFQHRRHLVLKIIC